MKLIFLIPAIFLCIVPFFKFPYGIYTLLRIIVTLSAAFIIYINYKKINNVNSTIVLFSLEAFNISKKLKYKMNLSN